MALLDRSERQHRACASFVQTIVAPLITCEAVIAESCYLLRRLPDAEAVLQNVAEGVFQIPFQLTLSRFHSADLSKIPRPQVDLADACLIQLATDLRTPDILTLDRDFKSIAWVQISRSAYLSPRPQLKIQFVRGNRGAIPALDGFRPAGRWYDERSGSHA